MFAQRPLADPQERISALQRQLSDVSAALGPPTRSISITPYDAPSSIRSYAEHFAGERHFLGTTLRSLIAEAHNTKIIDRIAAFELVGTDTVQRDIVTADIHMPEQLPEGAVPPVVNTSKRSVIAELRRYTLGAEVNLESLVTPNGRAMWAIKFGQLAAGFAVLFAGLLTQEMRVQAHPHLVQELRNGPSGRIHPLLVHDVRARDFDVFRKSPDGGGLSAAIERAKTAIVGKADMLLVASGVASVFATGPLRLDYAHAGPSSRSMLEYGADGLRDAPGSIRTFGGLQVVNFTGVEALGKGGKSMQSTRVVPTHTRSDPAVHACTINGGGYTSRVLDVGVLVQNVTLDYQTVRFRDMLANSRRFDPNGALSSKHQLLADTVTAEARAQKLTIDPENVDLFVFHDRDTYRVTRYLGDMPPKALTDATLDQMVCTTRERIRYDKAAERYTLDAAGHSGKKLSAAAIDSSAPVNSFGSHDPEHAFPVAEHATADVYQSTAGQFTLTHVDPESAHGRAIGADAIASAHAFRRSLTALHDALEPVFGSVGGAKNASTHPIFSGALLPAELRPTDKESPDYARRLSLLTLGYVLHDEDKQRVVAPGRALNMSAYKTPLVHSGDALSADDIAVVNAVRQHLTSKNASSATLHALVSGASVAALADKFTAHPIAKSKGFSVVTDHLKSLLTAKKSEEAVQTLNHLVDTLEKPTSTTKLTQATKTAWEAPHPKAGELEGTASKARAVNFLTTPETARRSGLRLDPVQVRARRYSPPMRARIDHGDPEDAAIVKALLFMPVTAQTFMTLARKDIFMPCAHLLERKSAEFTTSTSWVLASGKDLATIYHQQILVTMGRDHLTRQEGVVASTLTRALVHEAPRLYPLHDSFVHGYRGGYDATFVPENGASSRTRARPSITALMVPAGSLVGPERTVERVHSYTGRASSALAGSAAVAPDFIGALYYNMLDSNASLLEMTLANVLKPTRPEAVVDTMSAQDAQLFYDAMGKSREQMSYTPFGEHHGPGNGDIIRGAARIYPDRSHQVLRIV